MPTTHFAGDKKVGTSLLHIPEIKLRSWLVPLVPSFIETYHLTLLTVVWIAVNIVTAFYIANNHAYLWIVSLMIALQYITDLLDGEVGRQRATGLIKWGFYMDHFLDYVFLCSLVFVGFKMSPPHLAQWFFLLLIIIAGFMVSSFLSFAAVNKFQISYFNIGPTEIRLGIILINTYLIFFGVSFFNHIIPLLTIVCLCGLMVHSVVVQRQLWQFDMKEKNK